MSLSGNASTDNLLIGNVQGLNSIHGKSAYELAVIHGFEGTEEEWIASLKGEKGDAYILTEADKEEIADKVAVDNLQESAEKYIDSVIEEKDLEVTRTATGSAITIESANAPIPYLKLSGKTEQDGTPTPDAPIDLVSVGDSGSFEVGVYGRNILNHGVTTQTKDGLTITVNSDKSITVNGTATSAVSLQVLSYRKNTLGGLIFSGCPTGGAWGKYCFAVHLYKNDSTYIGNVCDVGGGVQIPESDICMICLEIGSGVTVNNLTFYPMISTARGVEYEPYKAKQTLTITDTLRRVGDIADVKDFARGMKTQRFGVVDLGTLNWYEQEAYKGCFHAQILGMSQKWSKGICSCYPFSDDVFTWLIANACADNTLYRAENDYVYIKDLSFPDATAFKSAMNGKYFVYELETPIETPISESELNAYRQLMTNKGNTTFLSEAEMEVDYYINKPNAQAIGNIHSQVNKDYFKLQQAIISTGGN